MFNKKPKKSQKPEFSLDTVKNNPVQRGQLEGFIEEIALCQGKINTEREAISNIRKEATDSLGIPGKLLMKLVREHLKAGTIDAELNDLEIVQAISQVIEESHNQP